jgi:hypothetical protein
MVGVGRDGSRAYARSFPCAGGVPAAIRERDHIGRWQPARRLRDPGRQRTRAESEPAVREGDTVPGDLLLENLLELGTADTAGADRLLDGDLTANF